MKTRTFAWPTLFSAAFFTLMTVSCGGGASSPGTTGSAPQIEVNLPLNTDQRRSYDTISMGRIAQGEKIEGVIAVKNVSDKPLVIVQVITGCGCTTAEYDTKPLEAGQTRRITYHFDSKGLYGHQFKSIEVITSDRHTATVYLDGEVYTP